MLVILDTSKKQDVPSPKYHGNSSSTDSTSEEKRDKIRPIGWVSKNIIGECRIPCNRAWCKTMAAVTPPKYTERSQKKALKAEIMKKK